VQYVDIIEESLIFTPRRGMASYAAYPGHQFQITRVRRGSGRPRDRLAGAATRLDAPRVLPMGKGPCRFKEVDVTRALRAARKAGVPVQVEIDLERKKMTLTPVKFIATVASESDDSINAGEWDHIQ
jgi:hypothetical protein